MCKDLLSKKFQIDPAKSGEISQHILDFLPPPTKRITHFGMILFFLEFQETADFFRYLGQFQNAYMQCILVGFSGEKRRGFTVMNSSCGAIGSKMCSLNIPKGVRAISQYAGTMW